MSPSLPSCRARRPATLPIVYPSTATTRGQARAAIRAPVSLLPHPTWDHQTPTSVVRPFHRQSPPAERRSAGQATRAGRTAFGLLWAVPKFAPTVSTRWRRVGPQPAGGGGVLRSSTGPVPVGPPRERRSWPTAPAVAWRPRDPEVGRATRLAGRNASWWQCASGVSAVAATLPVDPPRPSGRPRPSPRRADTPGPPPGFWRTTPALAPPTPPLMPQCPADAAAATVARTKSGVNVDCVRRCHAPPAAGRRPVPPSPRLPAAMRSVDDARVWLRRLLIPLWPTVV